jgi:hypothetical protein
MENKFSDKNANLKFVSIASGMQKVLEGNLNRTDSQSNNKPNTSRTQKRKFPGNA